MAKSTAPVWGANSTLITSAKEYVVKTGSDEANGSGNDTHVAYEKGATAFIFEIGNVGDDTLLNFSSNDTILNTKQIFDGNGDGFIAFGKNGVLDIDRESKKKAGADQIQVVGANNEDLTELRYLGTKDGLFAYSDSANLKNLWTKFGGADKVIEGTVGDDKLSFADGDKVLLVDNALGLNLGADTLTDFGKGDLLAFTSKLYDRTGNDVVSFGTNNVLDVSGAEGPLKSDPKGGPGGQIDFTLPEHLSIKFLGEETIKGVTYYYYGTDGTTSPVAPEL
jgi:hypothetical protein